MIRGVTDGGHYQHVLVTPDWPLTYHVHARAVRLVELGVHGTRHLLAS